MSALVSRVIVGGIVSPVAAMTWCVLLRWFTPCVTVTASQSPVGCGSIAAADTWGCASPRRSLQAAICATTSTLLPLARTTECGSTRRASKTTESTGSAELVDDRLSLDGHRRFGAHELAALLARVDEIMEAAGFRSRWTLRRRASALRERS